MHGSNFMNQCVLNSSMLHCKFHVLTIQMQYSYCNKNLKVFSLRKLKLMFIYLFQLIKIVILNKPNAVYFVPAVAGYAFYRDCFFAFVIKFFKVKIIYHLHGKGIIKETKNYFKFIIYKWFFNNSEVIHLSPIMYSDIENVVSTNQMHYVPNGVSSCDAALNNRCRNNSHVTILYLSNLIPSKGPLLLLESLRIVMKRGYKFNAIFAGNETKEITASMFINLIGSYNLNSYVSYVGPKYDNEKNNLFFKSDIFVFPSQYEREVWPLVILEAMSFGLPVITTSEGAISEFVINSETGFIVDNCTSEEIADKICYLCDFPEIRYKMGDNAIKHFNNFYTIDIFENNLVNTIDLILNIN